MQEKAANGLGKEKVCHLAAHNLKPRLISHWKPFGRESEITVHADDDGDEHCGRFWRQIPELKRLQT